MSATQPAGTTAELDEVALDAMVEPHADRGRPYARLKEYGTPIWALINRLGEPTPGKVASVAEEYDIPEAAVRAALRYYARNKKYIDAVIIINNEPFGLNE
jgi:hypothetical protein